jgi:hypothetical protein
VACAGEEIPTGASITPEINKRIVKEVCFFTGEV